MSKKQPQFGDVFEWRGRMAPGLRVMYVRRNLEYKFAWDGVVVRTHPSYDYGAGEISAGLNAMTDDNWVEVDE